MKAGSDMMPGGYAIQTSGLTKRFGDRTVVDGVDLLVPAGAALVTWGPTAPGRPR